MPNESNNTVVTSRYYPSISSVVNTDDIPDILGFVKEGIIYLFDNLHYKDLQYSKSSKGDAAFYSLTIVSKKRLDFEIPGSGIYLVLNPDFEDYNISSFPITIDYHWKILAYLKVFDLSNFTFSPQDFFESALKVFNVSEEQALLNFINVFSEPVEDGISKLDQFIDDIKIIYPDWNFIPSSSNIELNEIVESLEIYAGVNSSITVFAVYILSSDLNESFNNLKAYFKTIFPQDIEAYIKDILLPKISASLILSAAIEFPRSMLQPVYPEGHPNQYNIIPQVSEDGTPRAGFRFAEALFYASTEDGFGYEMDIALSSTSPAMIGNTGIILNIQRLKVDLSDTENIPEADLEGRPASFKGVYADEVSIVLPPKWFDGGDNHPGTTAKIGGYNMLIGSGGISGTIILEAVQVAPEVITSYYEDCFSFQYPIEITSSSVTTTIDNYGELLIYLNDLNGASYQFQYPLTTILTDGTVNQDMNAAAYASLLNDCTTSGTPPRLVKKLGDNGFEIWFTSFDMTFQQGHIVESNIQGGLKIPKLKDANGDIANIDIYGHLDDDGGFNVTASEQDGFQPIIIPNVLNIYINSLEVGRESGDEPFYIGTACDILFTNPIIQKFLGDQRIVIERLRIYSDGSFEIVGGAIAVPTNFTLKLGPVEISITGINFGSFQEEHNGVMRKYNYFGFDGGISLGTIRSRSKRRRC